MLFIAFIISLAVLAFLHSGAPAPVDVPPSLLHSGAPISTVLPILAAQEHGRHLATSSDARLSFAGLDWFVKDSHGARWDPGPCSWTSRSDASGVFADENGLHLTMSAQDGCENWASTEVWATRPLGYGTYSSQVSGSFKNMDPQATFGFFTWDDDSHPPTCWPEANCFFREIDFEISKWGVKSQPPIAVTVQPWTHDGGATRDQMQSQLLRIDNARDFGGSAGSEGGGGCNEWGEDSFNGALWQQLTLVLQWYPNFLHFFVFDGIHAISELTQSRGSLLTGWNVEDPQRHPTPGDERVHYNLWQCNWGGTPEYRRKVHVVVNKFEHTADWIDLNAAGITVPRSLEADIVPRIVDNFRSRWWPIAQILLLAGIIYAFLRVVDGIKGVQSIAPQVQHHRAKA